MHSLILAMAAPLAVSTAKTMGALTASAGESFAQVLGGLRSDSSDPSDEAAAAKKPASVTKQLESIADQLRQWLHQHGLGRPFELNFSVDSSGQEQLDVAGDEAAQIGELVDQHPNLRSQLSKLAASMQALTGSLGTGAVNLMIDDKETRAY